MKSAVQLGEDARSIWQAGVEAVRSERLVGNVIQRRGSELEICGNRFDLNQVGRIAVVGAGKAGAGMAAAVEHALGDELTDEKGTGWVNVPADCVRPLRRIQLHPARPAGVNEPTEAGAFGSERILEIVQSLSPRDLCLVLLSGGGSALLPAPVPEITLADKQAVTRWLSAAGATIGEMNQVRRRLSRIKGGNLARASRAGATLALIISDVVGDPLETIASGPTTDDATTDRQALAVLEKYASPRIPAAVSDYLARAAEGQAASAPFPATVQNYVIGNNQVALAAAEQRAGELGYAVESQGSANQGEANEQGRALLQTALAIRDRGQPLAAPACVLSGGEPVVQLAVTDRPRKGGRNQQLVLSALCELAGRPLEGIALLSGGTDGEDGPTDAAGALLTADVVRSASAAGLNPRAFLAINDAYTFFDQCGGLLKTGPTHTNVMDLRVAVIG